MAITRESKETAVEALTNELGQLKLAVLTDYRGLSVAEIQELRAQLRQAGISYRVSKNTLVKLALAATPSLKDVDPAIFAGPLALAIGSDDEIAPARIVYQYSKAHEALEITGAITAGGEVLSPAQVKALALLPTKEQLLGTLVGTLAAPISGLVGVLGAELRSIVIVLQAINNSKEN